MSDPRTPGRAGRAAALGLAVLAGLPAGAQRPLALTFEEGAGHARILARWADGDENGPRITASVASQVLLIAFDEPVAIDPAALTRGLPAWASAARLDADGRIARIALKETPGVRVTRSIDRTAVDLVRPGAADPPPVVSPLVARRAAAAAEAARKAAEPPPVETLPLEVRHSEQGPSSRIAFYWPGKVPYRAEGGEGRLKLSFTRRAEPDLAYLKVDPPANLASFTRENTPGGFVIDLVGKDGMLFRHYAEGDVVVVDISPPGAPPPEISAAGGAVVEAAGDPAEPVKPDPKSEPKPSPKPPAAPAATPVTLDGAGPVKLTPRSDAVKEGPGRTPAPKQAPATAGPLPVAGQAAAEAAPGPPPGATSVIGRGGRTTALADWVRSGAPASGVVEARIVPTPGGVEITIPWSAPVPAAVFRRGGVVWAVFAGEADLRVDPSALPAGFRARSLRVEGGAVLRIEAPQDASLSAEAVESAWMIRLAASGMRPTRFLKSTRAIGEDGRARVETMMIGAAGVVWFVDEAVGDEIAAVLAYGPSSASLTGREFVEASLPATAHGLAVAPKSDEVEVYLEGEKVVVALSHLAAASTASETADTALANDSGSPAYVDFEEWGGLEGGAWRERLGELERAAVAVEPETPSGSAALFDLARFYLAHELAHEALGVLAAARAARLAVEQDPRFFGLRGVANAMAGRFAEADADLNRGALRTDAGAALWRGYIAAEQGDWQRASDHFRLGEEMIFAYAPAWAARFRASAAEAALAVNDLDIARRHIDDALGVKDPLVLDRVRLVAAGLQAVVEGPEAAIAEYEDLSRTAAEPVAVRAEMERIKLAAVAGGLSPKEATERLEALRFRWRGDQLEKAAVGLLADQYIQLGRFREALQLVQGTALRQPDAPGARDLRIKSVEYFRRLYLGGEADRLDPIQSLALFYEFKDLTPIGVDGDEMIRKLSRRLVAFDLLEPAAELLQHQVDNRMRGEAKSAVAVDLASIYLMDRRPDLALASINSSRQPGLPKELALERRLIEASALLELGRYDHVVELTEGLAEPQAQALKAEAHWRARDWPAAAAALAALVPPAGKAAPADAPRILKAAIAARMARDPARLAALRADHRGVFEGLPDAASFDLITAQSEGSGQALSEAVRRLADAPTVDAFARSLKERFSTGGAG